MSRRKQRDIATNLVPLMAAHDTDGSACHYWEQLPVTRNSPDRQRRDDGEEEVEDL